MDESQTARTVKCIAGMMRTADGTKQMKYKSEN